MTSAAAEPLLLDDLQALRERKRALDRVSLATLLVVFFAAVIPWFLQAIPLDPAPAARAALWFTLAYWLLAAATERLQTPRPLLAATLALQASALIFLAGLWHLLGGLQAPALLLAFLIPTLAVGILLRPWHAAACAALSIAAVGLVAMTESPELRWYVSRVGLPRGLARSLPFLPPSPAPFPGMAAQAAHAAYSFVLLEGFALLEIAGALAVPPLVRLLPRMRARPGAAGGDVFKAAFRGASTPTALVDAEDGRILLASDGFVERMLLQPEASEGRRLFDVLSFAEPDRVRELLRAPGGTLPLCSYAVGPEARVARLEAQPLVHEGWTYACVRVLDLTELSFLDSAVGALDEPVLVVGPDDRLRYANRAASELFGELYLGLEVGQALARPDLTGEWWAGAQDRIAIDGVRYEVRSRVVVLQGGAEKLRLLSLTRGAPAPTEGSA